MRLQVLNFTVEVEEVVIERDPGWGEDYCDVAVLRCNDYEVWRSTAKHSFPYDYKEEYAVDEVIDHLKKVLGSV